MKRRKRDRRSPQQDEKKIAIRVKGISENQTRYIESIRKNTFTLAVGHAGTGKTFCAIGMALKYLFSPITTVEKIVVIRPAIPACDDSIGHLPGDAFDKMYPYFGSILDNIEHFIDRPKVRHLINQELLEIIPLSFLRGRTLRNSFIIVEEAQNISIDGMKMILTRVGEGSTIVVTGDINQRDKPRVECGLLDATQRFEDMEDFGIIELYKDEDVVRNTTTSKIIERYGD